jgi:hypothetical protein
LVEEEESTMRTVTALVLGYGVRLSALALRLAWPALFSQRRTTMLKWLIRRRLAAFERAFGYDASYAHDMLDVSTRAMFVFNRIMPMAQYRRDVPRDAWFAAAIATTLREDCGSCTQLNVTKAEREGVAPDLLRAIVNRDPQNMTPDAALGFRFAEATLAHAPEAHELREEIVRLWGKQALISLAFIIVTARVFPTMKYALGHGRACQRVTVGGATTPVWQRAA